MEESAETKVYEIVAGLGRAVSFAEIKAQFPDAKRNEVEQAVLKNLRGGRMWLNFQGLRVRS